jgi:hypothetical protein
MTPLPSSIRIGVHESGAQPQTLTEQLDALLAEHGLTAITISRSAIEHGNFWSINAHRDGVCGANGLHNRHESPAKGIELAIEDLNARCKPAIVVPELALAS